MLDFENRFILLDGAMGTMLQQCGAPMGKVPEALNITHPEIITGIHRQYIESGSQIIWWNRTNGFINEYLQLKKPDTNVGYILGRDTESYGYDRRSRFACPSQDARSDQTFTINYFYGLDFVLVTKITQYRYPSRTLRTSDYLDMQTTGAYNYAEKAPGSFRHKGSANVSFADGHTETLARNYVLARQNAYHILFHPTGIFPDTGQFNDW